MKHFFPLCLLTLFLCMACSKNDEGLFSVTDDTVVVFDDPVFKALCLKRYDLDNDGILRVRDIKDVEELGIGYDLGIRSLGGIEYFVNLKRLLCWGYSTSHAGSLERLDLRRNYKLEKLYCQYNLLTSLDVKGLKNLNEIHCNGNQLSNLDLSGLPRLNFLYCSDNQLAHLDLRLCKHIFLVKCANNGNGLQVELNWRQSPFISHELNFKVHGDEDLVFVETDIEQMLIHGYWISDPFGHGQGYDEYVPYDRNGDGKISRHEACYVKSLNLSCENISSLADLSHFIKIRWCHLYCSDREQFKSDLSWAFPENESMAQLILQNLPIGAVDLSKLSNLEVFEIYECDVEELDLTKLKDLKMLHCRACPKLKTVWFKNEKQWEEMRLLILPDHTEIKYRQK